MFTLDKRLIYLIFGWVLLASAACTPRPGSLPNTGDGQTPEAERNLAHTKWKLVSLGKPGGETPVIQGSTITLEFNAQGQAGGSGGCNSYGAHYEVQGNKLSFGEITSTLMACEQEGLGQQEQRYFQALETAGRFELAGDRLTIWYDNGQSVLNWLKSSGNPTPTSTSRATIEPTRMPTGTPTSAADQPTPTSERIHFETGATSARVTGHLQASGSHLYVLSALEGQIMTVELSFTEGEAILVVWGADGTVLMSDHAEASRFSGVLPSTEDYYILVRGRPDGETVYRMDVTIPP